MSVGLSSEQMVCVRAFGVCGARRILISLTESGMQKIAIKTRA